jgi:hypothetical protein
MAENTGAEYRCAIDEAKNVFDIDWGEQKRRRELWGREQLGQSILRGYWALRRAYVGAQVARLEDLVKRSEHRLVVQDETITSIEQWVAQPLIEFIEGKVVVSEEEWRRIADGTLELDAFLTGAQEDIGDRLPLRVVQQTHEGDTTLVFEKPAETPEA